MAGRPPGYPKSGGRKRGTPNKITPEKRAFLRAFIDRTRDEAFACWQQIKDPSKRFDLWLKASEFAYPKLGRLEHVGEGGQPLTFILDVRKGE